ncbi:MAG: TIGR02302 family protein [Alphaproteobacteria bacterium]|jgi:uncharacterized protein (TIGR02302 family)|nr:TIGR02302 family protein [Alphaproteobacteria bacterium]
MTARPTAANSKTPARPGAEAGRPAREPRRLIRLAQGLIGLERLAGLFVALALSGVLPALGPWVHAAVLLAFGVGIGWTAVQGLRGVAWPRREEGRRRLERDSGLMHRPLAARDDRQATGQYDPAGRALWERHQARLRALSGPFSLRLPRAGLAARDPLALRGLVLLLLLVTAVAAGDRRGERLQAAISPALTGMAGGTATALDVFITPPAYTGRAPVYLRAGTDTGADAPNAAAGPGRIAADGPIAVPEGSEVLARVSGTGRAPVLAVNGGDTAFEAVDADSFEITATLDSGEELAVRQGGRTLGAWPVRVAPDLAPTIAFAEEPAATERAAVSLAYEAEDDYGIATVSATVRLAEGEDSVIARDPIALELTVRESEPGLAAGTGYFDLTPHPWAGRPVALTLTATDEAGQTGTAPAAEFVLPERQFSHPIARAIIEQRRVLLAAPARGPDVAGILSDLSLRPARFGGDSLVFLALRSAAQRLTLADGATAAVDPVQQLLWDTALRIEEGDLLLAERALREAQQALMEALADENASDQEIARLMEELRQAMDRYMQALQQSLLDRMQRGEEMTVLPFDPEAQMLDREGLQQMLEEMQRLSEAGAREAAMQMLAELQAMMENLNTGPMQQGRADAMEQAMALLDNLQRLSEAQQALLDQTFDRSQGRPQGESPDPPPGAQSGRPPGQQPGQQPGGGAPGAQGQASATQEALRRALGELMPEVDGLIGEIPQSLGDAEQAMRRSTEALQGNRPGAAVDPQGEAVAQLQQAIRDIVNTMMDQMAQQGGGAPMLMQQGLRPGEGQDPLGRRPGRRGSVDTRDVEVPTESEVQRTRSILDELRRRLGDRDRPDIELDYLRRLLERF